MPQELHPRGLVAAAHATGRSPAIDLVRILGMMAIVAGHTFGGSAVAPLLTHGTHPPLSSSPAICGSPGDPSGANSVQERIHYYALMRRGLESWGFSTLSTISTRRLRNYADTWHEYPSAASTHVGCSRRFGSSLRYLWRQSLSGFSKNCLWLSRALWCWLVYSLTTAGDRLAHIPFYRRHLPRYPRIHCLRQGNGVVPATAAPRCSCGSLRRADRSIIRHDRDWPRRADGFKAR